MTAIRDMQDTSLLKIVSCGSVDDGKSTLIGHMLYDAKLIFADQAQALEVESKISSEDGRLDYSLLLDGLMAEREQGITIDVAYRYFSTPRRSFIVADAPGHEQYTRNMAVGASFADLAIVLVDITKGPITQTRRHVRICNLMGIRHFVFAVNKMDLAGFDEERYNVIRGEIELFCKAFDLDSVAIIPVSAREGDNVVNPSANMPWYSGPTLMEHLEEVDVSPHESSLGFSLPVQRVSRPEDTMRGFQGTVASGEAHVGDDVRIEPSGTISRIASISVAGTPAEGASTGQAVTVSLADEIDVSRGSVIVADDGMTTDPYLTATLLWTDDADLIAGKNYLMKLGSSTTPCTVIKIKHQVDVDTGEKTPVERVRMNEIATCELALGEKVAYAPFDVNRTLGSFILIDRLTNATAGCGIVEQFSRFNNLTWQNTDITRELREGLLGQRAVTIWFTGLSGSGKSTLANAVEKRLHAQGLHTMLLDGDNVRFGLNKDLGFDENDRIENIRRIAEVAKLMNDAGLIVITSFISPFIRDRQRAAEIIGAENFVEVYVSTPLEVCEQRDVKGLYERARRGEIADFTGVSSPYEAPENPTVEVNSSNGDDLGTAAQRIVEAALGD